MLGVACLLLATAFARLNEAYQEMTGQAATVRHHTPWLRSRRGERPQYQGVEPTLTTPERILVVTVVTVVTAFVLFEIWFFFFFFFFSASPIDSRSGRAALAPRTRGGGAGLGQPRNRWTTGGDRRLPRHAPQRSRRAKTAAAAPATTATYAAA